MQNPLRGAVLWKDTVESIISAVLSAVETHATMAAMRLQSERVQQSPPFVANATHGRNKLSQQHNDSARARRCCTRMVSRASSAGRRRADNPLILSGSVPCIPSAGAFAKHSSSMPGRRLSFAPVRVAPEDGGSHVDDVEEPLLDLKGLKQELSRQTSRGAAH